MKYLSNKRSLVKILAAGYMISACRIDSRVESSRLYMKDESPLDSAMIRNIMPDPLAELWERLSENGEEHLRNDGLILDPNSYLVGKRLQNYLFVENMTLLTNMHRSLCNFCNGGECYSSESLAELFFESDDIKKHNIKYHIEKGFFIECAICFGEIKFSLEIDDIYISFCCNRVFCIICAEKYEFKCLYRCPNATRTLEQAKKAMGDHCVRKRRYVEDVIKIFENCNLEVVAGLDTKIVKGLCNREINATRLEKIVECISRIVGTDIEHADFYLRILGEASDRNFKIFTDSSFNLSKELVDFLKKQTMGRVKELVSGTDISRLNDVSAVGIENISKINPKSLILLLNANNNVWELLLEKFVGKINEMNDNFIDILCKASSEAVELLCRNLGQKLFKISPEKLNSLLNANIYVQEMLLEEFKKKIITMNYNVIDTLCNFSEKTVKLLLNNCGEDLYKIGRHRINLLFQPNDNVQQLLLEGFKEKIITMNEKSIFHLCTASEGALKFLFDTVGNNLYKINSNSLKSLLNSKKNVSELLLDSFKEKIIEMDCNTISTLCKAHYNILKLLLTSINVDEFVAISPKVIELLITTDKNVLEIILQQFKGEIIKRDTYVLSSLCGASEDILNLLINILGKDIVISSQDYIHILVNSNKNILEKFLVKVNRDIIKVNNAFIYHLCRASEETLDSLFKIEAKDLVKMDEDSLISLIKAKKGTRELLIATYQNEICEINKKSLCYLSECEEATLSLLLEEIKPEKVIGMYPKFLKYLLNLDLYYLKPVLEVFKMKPDFLCNHEKHDLNNFISSVENHLAKRAKSTSIKGTVAN